MLITMLLMGLSLFSLMHTGNRLLDAQQSQFAADASALGCVLVEDDVAQAVLKIVEQNFAELVEARIDTDQCVMTVRVDRVERRAIAVSVGGLDLPTLQR